MVQAINSVKSYNATKQSFGCTKECETKDCKSSERYIVYQKPSTTDRLIVSAGRNFIAGAVISAVFDGIHNGVAHLRKMPEQAIKFSDVAKRAGIWGACWVAASAALALIFPSRRQ